MIHVTIISFLGSFNPNRSCPLTLCEPDKTVESFNEIGMRCNLSIEDRGKGYDKRLFRFILCINSVLQCDLGITLNILQPERISRDHVKNSFKATIFFSKKYTHWGNDHE